MDTATLDIEKPMTVEAALEALKPMRKDAVLVIEAFRDESDPEGLSHSRAA